MWRVWHRLFGWHYVAIRFGGNHCTRRVLTDGDGRPYVTLYGDHVDLKTTGREWWPLTFPRAAVQVAPDAAESCIRL